MKKDTHRWQPLRAAIGAYLFSFLQVLGIYLQGWLPSVPAQVFQVAPFPLMIFTLLVMYQAQKETVSQWVGDKSWMKTFVEFFSGAAPSSLGKPHHPE
jgi:simple sugar transport system permease protein